MRKNRADRHAGYLDVGQQSTMKLRNNSAASGWGFSLIFLVMCGLFTYILVRDGSSHIQIYPPDIPEFYPPWVMPLVLAVFWVAGIGFASYVASKPCISVEVRPDKSVVVVNHYPFSKSVRHISAEDLSLAEVIESTDDESDPYFETRISASDGFAVCIAEGHDRERCESVCASFNDAIGKKLGVASWF